ncbi:MAG: flagellar brake protein [Acetivibrionales bacterium]|jgi:c-di-GMP-binding flagellar brake protein YcgR
MNITELKIGTRLEIELLNHLGDKKGPAYVSQLLRIVDQENIIIASPIHKSVVIPVHAGTRVRVFALHETHGLLSFNATAKSSHKKDNLSLLLLNITSDLIKIQRRDFYRLQCCIDVDYYILDNENENHGNHSEGNNSESKEYKKAIAKNISASGICIVVEEKIPKDSLLHLSICLGNTLIKSTCKVIRSTLIENTRGNKYELGLSFVKMSRHSQEILIKYIFDQQRELLKKDLVDR